MPGFDVVKWMEDHPEAQAFESPQAPGRLKIKEAKKPNKTKDAYSQARGWLSHMKPAIEGQNGSGHTFGIACTLLKGFDLSQVEALSLLKEWNVSCQPPWSDDELERKIADADAKPSTQANGWKLKKIEHAFSDLFQQEEPKSLQTPDRAHSPMLDDPSSIALRFSKAHKIEAGLCQYRWWNDQFFRWNGSYYEPLTDKEMDSILFWFIEDAYINKYFNDCNNCPLDQVEKISKKKVSNSVIQNVKTGLRGIIAIHESGSEPFWLVDPPNGWQAQEIIPASNRLVHLPSFATNQLKSHIIKTPKFFSTYSLDYEFNYNKYSGLVQPPYWWGWFLNSIWPNDPDSISTLQEWFGYLLTPNTSLQKLLMLIGTRRSGKGTILRILDRMLGSKNVTYPTFKLLTDSFGKQSLIGKSLAIFGDARITSKTDVGDLVELLLSISGEDAQTINRKFMESTTKKLFCRFLISSNLIPSLSENSGALVSRAIILRFDESFLGREDTELENKLIPEIPEILRWSIDGWIRLSQRKCFLQPTSGAQLITHFLNLSSPISNYVHDCLDEGQTHEDDLMEMFSNYRLWCRAHNRDYVGDLPSFQRNLQAVIPNISFSTYNTVHNGDSMAWSKTVSGVQRKPMIGNGLRTYGSDSLSAKQFEEYYEVD